MLLSCCLRRRLELSMLACLYRMKRFVIFLLWIANVVYRFYYNDLWLSMVIKFKTKILPHSRGASSFWPCLIAKTFVNSVKDSLYHTGITAAWLLHMTHICIIINMPVFSLNLHKVHGLMHWNHIAMHRIFYSIYYAALMDTNGFQH